VILAPPLSVIKAVILAETSVMDEEVGVLITTTGIDEAVNMIKSFPYPVNPFAFVANALI